MPGPLQGVRVLEVASILLGPLACQLLADLGADVIKIEPPTGDGLRTVGDYRNTPNMAALFLTCNRNKRSLVLDLKQKSGRSALFKLTETADVVLHNSRPGVMAKLGLDYPDFKAVNPKLIYCAAQGYGKKGPYGNRGALDDAIQSASGMASLTISATGEPRFLPMAMADKNTALTTVYAIMGALFHRERTGEGQELEVAMFENMVHFTMLEHLWGRTFEPPIGTTNYAPMTSKNRKPCNSKDGHLTIITYLDPHWEIFATRSGHPELTTDPRFKTQALRIKNISDMYAAIGAIIPERTTAEWVEMFKDTSVPITPVNTLDDVIADPHLEAVGFWKTMEHPTEGTLRMAALPVSYEKTPVEIRRLAPNLGEHSAEILNEAGYNEAEIEALVKTGATVQAA